VGLAANPNFTEEEKQGGSLKIMPSLMQIEEENDSSDQEECDIPYDEDAILNGGRSFFKHEVVEPNRRMH
jgi:hypothetical protein